ncbi:hypothetical protein V1264_010990 [Littorina saxatilis]|uniref:Uncharacterized protein n=1 Tax=Littorina saxatilis TaxID=31220 RepID=A0AAN9BTY9_9CAEN
MVGILMSFMENVHAKFSLIAAMCGFAAAGSILIEFAVYAGEGLGTAYGYSFYLTIVACVLAIVSGVCFLLGKGRE